MPSKSDFPPIPLPTETLDSRIFAKLWQYSVEHPERPAFVCAENAWSPISFREVWIRSASVAAFLHSRGFGHGDVACIVLPNSWQFAVFCIGVAAAGGAHSGASALFTDYELERQFVDSQCNVVLTDENHFSRVLVAAKNAPKQRTIIVVRSKKETLLPWGITCWDEVLNSPPDVSFSRTQPRDIKNDLFMLPYSSGTTGAPKGVMMTHFNIGNTCNVYMSHMEREICKKVDARRDWSKESVLLFLPFYHIYGFIMMLTALLEGRTAVLMSKFDREVFYRSIEQHRDPLAKKYDLSSLVCILSGAAPAGKDLCDEFLAKYPNVKVILQGYGMTETGMASHLPVINGRLRDTSVGKLVANCEHKVEFAKFSANERQIVDVETGQEVEVGQRGEIWIRGPSVMLGYLNRTEATHEALDEEGFLHDADGVQLVEEESFIGEEPLMVTLPRSNSEYNRLGGCLYAGRYNVLTIRGGAKPGKGKC